MAKRISVTKLNASTIDILNTIRANASAEYQSLVPEIEQSTDIPAVGEVLYGYPALANQFINALVNRIALVRVKSATFNNAYAKFKKGYLEFGETVEETFVNICKAREFSVEKAASREFKRTLPDVRTAFHTMNYRVQYPITIQDEDLRMAFLTAEGMQDLIAKIVNSVSVAQEYDEFLLFKYLIIKAVTTGKMTPISVGDGTDLKEIAAKFRGTSLKLPFISTKYNLSGVHTNTKIEDQAIFLDTDFESQFDVEVLASAFNMDKATFLGNRESIDDWTTFDNDRFSIITENSTMLEPVTDAELAIMANVKGVLVDTEWFQVYDNQNKFTEKYVASGEYWNYFYNVWKTISSSPFSNAIVFVTTSATTTLPDTITLNVESIEKSDVATIITFNRDIDTPTVQSDAINFVYTQRQAERGIAVHKYGAYIVPASDELDALTPQFEIKGTMYTTDSLTLSTLAVGDTVTFAKQS